MITLSARLASMEGNVTVTDITHRRTALPIGFNLIVVCRPLKEQDTLKTVTTMKLLNSMCRHDCVTKRFLNEQRSFGAAVDSYKFKWSPQINNMKDSTSQPESPTFLNKEPYRNPKKPRYNEFGIQMISEQLYKQLFPNAPNKKDIKLIDQCLQTLKSYNFDKIQEPSEDVDLKIPQLDGQTVEEHFMTIGEKQSKPYRELLLKLLVTRPEMPESWVLKPGWTRYAKDGIYSVDHPLEDAIVFDVEVCCSVGPLPTLATAVSKDAWYSWVSKDLENCSNTVKHSFTPDNLIPLERKISKETDPAEFFKPRIVVGHNVSYDRARVKEQYWLEQTGRRFLDSMSMHICISGVTSYQKALLKAGVGSEEWSKLTSLNSLANVYELYCGKQLSKEKGTLFLTGSLHDIKNNFQALMSYCANDVLATYDIMKHMFPLFLERFSHPVTLAGMLELQTTYVPVNKNWKKYLFDSQQAYDDLDLEGKSILIRSANEACRLLHNEKYKENLWMWDQDWSLQHLALKKTVSKLKTNEIEIFPENFQDDEYDIVEKQRIILKNKYKEQRKLCHRLHTKTNHLCGYPKWFRNMCTKPIDPSWSPEPELVSTSMKIVPKLLRLTWCMLPLHHVNGFGWGYLLPYKTEIPIDHDNLPTEKLVQHYFKEFEDSLCNCSENKTQSTFVCTNRAHFRNNSFNFCKDDIGKCYGMVKLPHKDGNNLNVGNPLSRDFINKFSDNELSGATVYSKKIIQISRMLSYWRNNKERIENQLVCWLPPGRENSKLNGQTDIGVILPLVIVCGTLTRRAVEPTWMTASNAIVERVGSELRGIVQAPPGYALVGADVDSQELWIASLLGDANSVRIHGATPLGWMTLNGKKSDGTDMHSVTAKAVGISRNHAKILNYARIYGAGQKFAERLLKQFNPGMSDAEASKKAAKMMHITKGKKMFKLKDEFRMKDNSTFYTREGARQLCSIYQKSKEELFSCIQWHGGSESSMFNSLEEIANKLNPSTPFLNSRLSRALEPSVDGNDKYMPTRINWVVQSGAVDFLHLMLVCMRWFLGNEARFCLSFHDEVRYLVPERQKYKAALALHVTNLLTRAFCVSRLGMTDLPQSVAFFSSVDVDVVLRKESTDDNKTPSNPFGLSKGYGVPIGESLDIYKAILKANGVVGLR
ncbi:DNA polymerase subunit gamma-1, mitochondrial [Cimex lectularius]|uniref:DNA polymerase subunit gamma-1 n=1 Tax=Cimex lectularius TaxID=79782 RepID=A0A8I6SHY3_CIMLE|nr:DNA polymerase subunit gamma-1, mitochondrial [Cimex lectularius]